MATLLETVARTTKARRESEAAFRQALANARPAHTWAELATITGLTKNGVKYLVQQHQKGETR